MTYRGFKDLDVWTKGIDITDQIYDITNNFPGKEKYGLCSQMQRAAVSVPSNIAEGYRRMHPKDFLRFLRIALGSCAELETQLIIASRRNYISEDKFNSILENIDHQTGMIMNLIRSITQKI